MAKKSDKKMIELENEELESDFSPLSSGVNIHEPYPKPIRDIFRDYKDKKIILQPEFQRDFVWPGLHPILQHGVSQFRPDYFP